VDVLAVVEHDRRDLRSADDTLHNYRHLAGVDQVIGARLGLTIRLPNSFVVNADALAAFVEFDVTPAMMSLPGNRADRQAAKP
jgi:hypothetical protein